MHPNNHCSTTAKTWKKPKCPSTDEWINILHINILIINILLNINILINGIRDYHTKWIVRQRNTNIKWHHLYMESLKKWYLFTNQKQTHRQIYGYQRGKGGRDKLGDWNEQIHTTIHKINNKHSTENDIQYLITNYNGKEYEKYIYTYT